MKGKTNNELFYVEHKVALSKQNLESKSGDNSPDKHLSLTAGSEHRRSFGFQGPGLYCPAPVVFLVESSNFRASK